MTRLSEAYIALVRHGGLLVWQFGRHLWRCCRCHISE